ncbi:MULTISPECIES: helix-hairpin-helix domain-containing protein [unclassified Raoultella]|uniref:helix-hairpin-helix domain-containing protein n=1 Tax=unclassified Raoultella TaxID=2627600 RepID=UPI0013596B8F|nr:MULTISPECIES: helix-hairpin-helix domain-containing protein [unclassified Raoultella]
MKPRVKAIVVAAALLCAAGSPMAQGAPAEGKAQVVTGKSSASTGRESVRAKAPDSAKVGESGATKVSINSGSAQDLMEALNGVGLKKAQGIVSYREEFGPFKTIDDLKQVPGMGHALVERNLAHLTL